MDPKILCIYTLPNIHANTPIINNVPNEASMKWSPGIVTWKLINETGDIPDHEFVHTIFALAFTHWGLFIKDISFQRVYGNTQADITIEFLSNSPMLPSPSTLAVTYYPNPNNPQITSTFNAMRHLIWSADGKPMRCQDALNAGLADGCTSPDEQIQTINLLQVACHEMGHAIGLVHTNDCPKCMMYPFYHNDMELQPEEITIAQNMYGKRNVEQHIIDSFNSILNRIKSLNKYI